MSGKCLLILYIVSFVFFGLVALVAPDTSANLMNFSFTGPGARMEFMAAYGGLMLGIAGYLFYCLNTSIRSGLVAVITIVGTLLAGRILGVFFDEGITSIQTFFFTIEGLTMVLVGSHLISNKPSATPAIA
ncbi:MAG: DUF4345 family protein [Oleiphilaceae bacterium]|nr:DUF4345 family protein [Oleiphilaceae bacterium]